MHSLCYLSFNVNKYSLRNSLLFIWLDSTNKASHSWYGTVWFSHKKKHMVNEMKGNIFDKSI